VLWQLALAPESCHVGTIPAYYPAAYLASVARFFPREFMRGALGVCGVASEARSHSLSVRVHRGEAAA
jgi:hypothetical protein